MTVCHVTRSKVTVKVTEVRNVQKWLISKSCLLRWCACNQQVYGDTSRYDTSRQYLNFNWTNFFYIHPHSVSLVFPASGVQLQQMSFASYE